MISQRNTEKRLKKKKGSVPQSPVEQYQVVLNVQLETLRRGEKENRAKKSYLKHF